MKNERARPQTPAHPSRRHQLRHYRDPCRPAHPHRLPKGLSGLFFKNRTKTEDLPRLQQDPKNKFICQAAKELQAYFADKTTAFKVPVHLEGTDFQKSVWSALAQIPHGETTTYGQIADKIKNPKAVRAVGLATGANPVSIIIPCHRVIGKNGTLTGFGGGLDRKRHLLKLEKIDLL